MRVFSPVQWLGLHAFTAWGTGLIPGWGSYRLWGVAKNNKMK